MSDFCSNNKIDSIDPEIYIYNIFMKQSDCANCMSDIYLCDVCGGEPCIDMRCHSKVQKLLNMFHR